MAETERHRSMEDVFEKVGALGAQFTSLTSRLDALATERQQQHVEAIKLLTSTVEQYREIKHRLENTSTKFDALDHKMDRFGATLESHAIEDLARFDKHEDSLRESAAVLATQVTTNRESLMARLDDLFVWRARVRGAWAVVGALGATGAAIYGHDIWDTVSNILHWRQK